MNETPKVLKSFVMDGWESFNFILATQWAFPNGLGFTETDGPETIVLTIFILREMSSPSFCQGIKLFGRKL